jgi:isopenicillin N synthase-like dioxygenase
METYYDALTRLARQLLPLFALALGLPRERFLQEGYFDRPVALLRLLRYTAEQSTPESGVLACGAHSDYGMFTLLTTDDVPGLQIRVDNAQAATAEGHSVSPPVWVDVPPRPGDFVVNIGDLLQRWSNDTFK